MAHIYTFSIVTNNFLAMSCSKITAFLTSLIILVTCSKLSINIGLATPITLQTYAIGLIILLAPPEIIFISIFSYVALGVLGLPVFSGNSAGLKILTGATGGYIIGFLISAALFFYLKMTFVRLFNLSILLLFCWIIILHIIIICCGFIRLAGIIGYKEAFYSGVLALTIPAIIKSLMIITSFLLIQRIILFIQFRYFK